MTTEKMPIQTLICFVFMRRFRHLLNGHFWSLHLFFGYWFVIKSTVLSGVFNYKTIERGDLWHKMEKFVENFARRDGGRKRRPLRPLRRRTSLEKGAVFLFSGCCGSTVLRVACDIPDDGWYIIDFLKLEPFSLDGDGKALAVIGEFLVGDTISIVGTLTGD